MNPVRILVAGIGNIFLGDDAFGVEVAQRMLGRPQPEGVRVVDFGIRGLDLAYALLDDYDTAILVDALPRGESPGTVYLMEPHIPGAAEPISAGLVDAHGMTPLRVLQMVHALGGQPKRVLVVGCEPATLGDELEGAMGLSIPVEAAVGVAISMVESLIEQERQVKEAISYGTYTA